MKNIAIVGSRGMVGSDLVRLLNNTFSITEIHRDNYAKMKGKTFDIVINANGNSKRYWANEHPREDFIASTVSVYNSLFDFSCGRYIYISSPDVYEHHDNPSHAKETVIIDPMKLEPYGFHKHMSELLVQKYSESFLILRCSMMLGVNLSKGPFFDMMRKQPLFITSNSRLQAITTQALAEIIEILIRKNISDQIVNIGGIGTYDFNHIRNVRPEATRQVYEMNISKVKTWYPNLRMSREYVRSIIPL